MVSIEELDWSNCETTANPIAGRDTPLVIRGLAGNWPLTLAAMQSTDALCDYLMSFDCGLHLQAMIAEPRQEGRFFYTRDLARFNFKRMNGHLTDALDILRALEHKPRAPGFYIGSTEIAEYFPGMEKDCSQSLAPDWVSPNIWIGNRSQVATHNDHFENIACVAAGRRRFTLFPPEQESNLYIASDKPSPAGRPISLVNLKAPDLKRFPRFGQALASASAAELNPGDAIYIPTNWWHNVESLEAVNILVNFWWKPQGLSPDE